MNISCDCFYTVGVTIMELACVSPYMVTHHCIHEEGDSLSQHMVVFGGDFGPAKEPVQLVQGGHLVREARLACQTRKRRGEEKYLLSPDLPLFQVRLVCKKESWYRPSIREFHLRLRRRRAKKGDLSPLSQDLPSNVVHWQQFFGRSDPS